MRLGSGKSRSAVALFVAVATAVATLAAVDVMQPATAAPQGAGRLDNSFDADGMVEFDTSPSLDGSISVVLDAARRPVILAGLQNGSSSLTSTVLRLTYDGQPDRSFSPGGHGAAKISWGGDSARATDLAIDRQGRILVLATKDVTAGVTLPVVARLRADGTLDTSFGSSGFADVALGASDAEGTSITTDSLNRVVVAGYGSASGYPHATVARLLEDGSTDSAFGIGEPTDFGGTDVYYYEAVAVDASDRVIAVGTAFGDALVNRFSSSGVYDADYPASSANGVFDVGAPSDVTAQDVAMARDGSGIAVGVGDYNGSVGGVIRLDDSGAAVSSFGNAGTKSFASQSVTAVEMPTSDTVLIGGGIAGDYYVGRLGQDGQLDTSYGDPATQGIRTVPVGTPSALLPDLAADGAGAAVFVYGDQSDGRTLALRLTPDLPPGPRAASKVLFTEQGIANRFMFGMTPDGEDIVSLGDSSWDLDHFEPVANDAGTMAFALEGGEGLPVRVLTAPASHGAFYSEASAQIPADSPADSASEPSIDIYGNVGFVRGGCGWVAGQFGNGFRGPCGVTSFALWYVAGTGQYAAYVKNGDVYIGSATGNDETRVTNYGTVDQVKWGFDGSKIAFTMRGAANSSQIRVADVNDHLNLVFAGVQILPDTLVVNAGDATISSFALAPDGGDPSVLWTAATTMFKTPISGIGGDVIYTGKAPQVGGWTRQLGMYVNPVAALEPVSIRTEDVPLQSQSPATKEKDSDIEAAGLSKLGLIQSPISKLGLIKSTLSKLGLIKSPISKLGLIQSGLSKLGLIQSPLIDKGLEKISLAEMVITQGPSWHDRLLAVNSDEAAELASLPLQAVSLGEVLELRPAAELPSLEQLDLTQGLFGTVSVLPFLLGSTSLRAMQSADGVDGIDWCAVFESRGYDDCGKAFGGPDDDDGLDNNLLGLQIAGFDLDNLPAPNDIRTLTVDDVDFASDAFLPSLIVDELDLHQLSIGSALVRNITPDPNAVVNCSVVDCSSNSTLTLDGAQRANAFRVDGDGDGVAVLGDLGRALDGYLLTELALGVWGVPGDDPYDQPLETLGINATTAGSDGTLMGVSFARIATGRGATVNPTVSVALPDGFVYKPGSASWENDSSFFNPLPDPLVVGNTLTWDIPVSVGDADQLSVRFTASPTAPTEQQATASISDGFSAQVVGSDPFQLTDALETGNDPYESPLLNKDTLYFSRLDSATDIDYFRVPAPEPGSTLTLYLSQLKYNADFVAYHPISTEGPGAPLRPAGPAPTLDSIGEAQPKLFNGGEPLTTDGEADIPLLANLPVAGLSNNIGNKAERIEVITWPHSGGDFDAVVPYILQVSGFNGAHGAARYSLRYTLDPPKSDGVGYGAPDTRFSAAGPYPSLPPLPASGPSSLILTNTTRFRDVYGQAGADQVATSLASLAGATNGTVFPVDAIPEVRDAYALMDSQPGNSDLPNNVVRTINTAVDDYLGAQRSELKSIVLAGADPILPMARVPDLTQIANEQEFGQELRETAVGTNGNNALLGAALDGRILSDDPYGSFAPRSFSGTWLYAPDVALGRLVETPPQIEATIAEFRTPAQAGDGPGVLRPDKTLSTGYDFMSRMAGAINDSFEAQLPSANHSALDDNLWNRSAVTTAVVGGGDTPDLISLNAHYSPEALAPASRVDPAHEHDPDVPAADIAASANLRRTLLFTMGCHSGFNIENFLAGTSPADWPEAAAGDAVSAYVGNTGFGLGLREVDAFSQKLFTQFALNLGSYNIGEALRLAKQEYLADGVTNPYDYKVLAQTTFFGVPGYTIAGAVAPPAPAPNPSAQVDPGTGILTASVDFDTPTGGDNPPWTRVVTASGDYWKVRGGSLAIAPNRPIQPQLQRDVTQPDQTAVGALVTGAELGDDETGFDPVLARPVIDDADREPEIQFGAVMFPADLADVTDFDTSTGARQRLVTSVAQFTSTGLNDAGKLVGTERRLKKVSVDVLYRPAGIADPDRTAPTLTGVQALQGPNATAFRAQVADPESDIVKVLALYRVIGQPEWRSLELVASDAGGYGGAVAVNDDLEFFVQAVNSQGLVGSITNRGRQFNETPVTVDPDDAVTVVIEGTKTNGYYTSEVTVRLTSAAGSQIFITKDGGAEEPYPAGGVVFDTDGNHALSYRTAAGTVGVVAIPIDLLAPTVVLSTPAEGTPRYVLKERLPASYACEDTSLQSCVGDLPDGTPIDTATITTGTDTRSFSVAATDAVGRSTSVTHQYKVGYAPAEFPCADGKGHQVGAPLSSDVPYSTGTGNVSVRFRVCDAAGVSQGPPTLPGVALPREVMANGELGAPALGACRPILDLVRLCVPLLSKRQTAFHYDSSYNFWAFRHDTTGLSPGLHRFRISLDDGTSIDYLLSVP